VWPEVEKTYATLIGGGPYSDAERWDRARRIGLAAWRARRTAPRPARAHTRRAAEAHDLREVVGARDEQGGAV